MNAIFLIILTISIGIITFTCPDKLIGFMTDTTSSAVTLSVKLIAVYTVWFGFFEIMKETKLTEKLSKALNKPINALFGQVGNAKNYISMNISANLLGIGAIATKSGIEAMKELELQNNTKAQTLLFVMSATSLQLFPFSVISLLTTNGAINPSSILAPTLLSTALSTLIGILLVKMFVK